MNYHVRDYHRVLQTPPLELNERDFDVALSFGGPQEERRLRAAQQKAQLALVPPAPLQMKAAPVQRPPVMNKEMLRMMDAFIEASTKTTVALGDRVKRLDKQSGALSKRVQELEDLSTQQAAELVELRSENKALGQLVVNTQHPKISLDPTHGVKH